MTYILKTEDGQEYYIDITTRIGFNFRNSVVVYEAIGEDGGFALNNGRLNSTLNMNITFSKLDIGGAFTAIARLRSLKKPVLIAGNSKSLGKLFGRYLIESIPGDVEEGTDTIKVTVNLVEYRQANVKKALVNTIYTGGAVLDFLNKSNFFTN